MDFLKGLNPKQKEAVECIDGALLILAGAGSGKTKTLISRLAYLIGVVGIDPSSILCLTFTNKASAEMRERALKMLDATSMYSKPLLCTFHKFGLLFLKKYISYLERESNFVLLDSDDVKKIIKSIESKIATSTLASAISFYKNATLEPCDVLSSARDGEERKIAKVYELYQEYLSRNNLLDFDDLLFLTYKILEQNPSLAHSLSQKYSYIMVDEYQDTNPLQYKILRLLTSSHCNLCVVGDDDQSIYGWRGADIRNILEFTQDFPEAKMIKLEQNYRSTPQILAIANALISKNTQRLGKVLEPMLESGEEVSLKVFESDREEIESIAKKIIKLHQNGVGYENIAILYRLNGMAKSVEDGLLKAKIPYKIIGSIKFYERAEVKDVISYLRLMVNIHDNFSLLRVLNRPKRGFGKTSQEKLIQGARNQSIYEFFSNESECKACIGEKNYKTLKDFFELIAALKEALQKSFESFEDEFCNKIDILSEYPSEKEERGSNLKELFASLKEYISQNKGIEDFLNDLSLSSDADNEVSNAISCMSVHLSKGLEFDYVFVIGCENGFFPLLGDSGELEEERRLAYVAFTRAKKELALSYTHTRYYRGKPSSLPPSKFLFEANLLKSEGERREEGVEEGVMASGVMVRHKIFGVGRVLEVSGKGKEMKVKVSFGGNERVILASFLELM